MSILIQIFYLISEVSTAALSSGIVSASEVRSRAPVSFWMESIESLVLSSDLLELQAAVTSISANAKKVYFSLFFIVLFVFQLFNNSTAWMFSTRLSNAIEAGHFRWPASIALEKKKNYYFMSICLRTDFASSLLAMLIFSTPSAYSASIPLSSALSGSVKDLTNEL